MAASPPSGVSERMLSSAIEASVLSWARHES
jgi:hypothetical protein